MVQKGFLLRIYCQSSAKKKKNGFGTHIQLYIIVDWPGGTSSKIVELSTTYLG